MDKITKCFYFFGVLNCIFTFINLYLKLTFIKILEIYFQLFLLTHFIITITFIIIFIKVLIKEVKE